MVELKIIQDTDPSLSPREYDNLGIMVCWHRSYNLGDEQPKEDPQQWFTDNITEGCVFIPLYLYDHSGITMSTKPFSCPWDSGQVGWIFTTPERIKEISNDEGLVASILEDEVKLYDQYLRGAVWGYKYGDDSCWGFYGDELEETGILDALPDEARPMAEAAWEARS